MSKSLETGIAEFVADLDETALTDDVLAPLRHAVLDCLACILAGVPETVSRETVAHVLSAAPSGPTTIIGIGERTSVDGAALAGGTMGHAADYDDVSWSMWGHATAPVLPAVLAIAERDGLSGADVLLAFLAGLELEARLGTAAAPVHYASGWHPTATVGAFGAAVGAAKALRLDAEGVGRALGITASRAAGIRENFGTMTKPLHVGFAARDGVEAALLAARGVTGAARALDGTYGFFNVLAPGHAPTDGLLEALGNPFDITGPGLSYKKYPSCSDTHPTIDGVLELKDRHGLEASDVERMRTGITPVVDGNLVYHRPETELEGKFSLEYCMAAAMARGRVGLAEFRPGVIEAPAIQGLIARSETFIDTELPEPERDFASPASVEIETADGRTLRTVVTRASGHPGKRLTEADLEAKFRDCAEGVLDPGSTERAVDLVARLETLPRIRDLMTALTPTGEPLVAVAGE